MPVRPLPENPSLENLKKQAKALLKGLRAGDAEVLAWVKEFHPRAAAGFKLSDAQLVTARSYGFASWAKLKQHLEAVGRFSFDPLAAPRPGSPAEAFIRDACLTYDDDWHPSRLEKARHALAAHPHLGRADVFAAAASGDAAAVREMVARDPSLVHAKGGPFGWESLLYACYSRLDTLEAARALLAAGADANAGFLWRGNVPPFTALTGAFGDGEGGSSQPPHPRQHELARLLLERGADPNDEQTLYNRHFRRGDDHLVLLLEFGLGRDQGGPWLREFPDRMRSPAQMLVEELWSAARKGYFERVKLLVAHGADVNATGFRDGRTPLKAALRAGQVEIASYLLEHGALAPEPDADEAFAAACIAGRREEVAASVARDPRLLDRLDHHRRVEMLHRAVEANRPDGIRLMAELGFPLGDMTRHDGVGINLAATPLHNAASLGNLDMVKLLIALGARTDVRDPQYNGTPLGWAATSGQAPVVEHLLPSADVFDAVYSGAVERAAELLRKDPSLAKAVDARGYPLVFHLHPDLDRLEEMARLLRAHGVDFQARDQEGKTAAERSGDADFARALQAWGR